MVSCLERTKIRLLFLWKDFVILKGLIFNSFHVGKCDGLERTDFR